MACQRRTCEIPCVASSIVIYNLKADLVISPIVDALAALLLDTLRHSVLVTPFFVLTLQHFIFSVQVDSTGYYTPDTHCQSFDLPVGIYSLDCLT